MNTYTYYVQRGGMKFTITFEFETKAGATERIEEMYPAGTWQTALTTIRAGETLEDYLGAESMARLNRAADVLRGKK